MPSGRGLVRFFLAISFLGMGALGGVFFFHAVVMPWFVRHGAETEVPDLLGRPVGEIGPRLAEAHVTRGTMREAYHDQVPAGHIVRQSPPPGFEVKQGRAVDLVVSRGQEALRVPQVEGESLVHARFLLMQAGLKPGDVRTIHSEAIPSGHVVASSPMPGEQLGGREEIDFLVSQGPRPRKLVMPELRGQDPDEAAVRLQAAGLKVEMRYWPGARSKWPRVSRQNPPSGHPVDEGATVQLIME